MPLSPDKVLVHNYFRHIKVSESASDVTLANYHQNLPNSKHGSFLSNRYPAGLLDGDICG